MWTDEDMPKDIGVPTNVTVYASILPVGVGCKFATMQVEVMRCSLINHDFIYRYISNSYFGTTYPDVCDFAFCGMM